MAAGPAHVVAEDIFDWIYPVGRLLSVFAQEIIAEVRHVKHYCPLRTNGLPRTRAQSERKFDTKSNEKKMSARQITLDCKLNRAHAAQLDLH